LEIESIKLSLDVDKLIFWSLCRFLKLKEKIKVYEKKREIEREEESLVYW